MDRNWRYFYDFLEKKGLHLTLKAAFYAQMWHLEQKRKNGSPYIMHPLAVCYILIIHGVADDCLLAAALLHDVIEDCGISGEELGILFPPAVVRLVMLVSKEKGEPAAIVFGRIAADMRAVLLKLADRVDNFRDASVVFTPERLDEYVQETEEYVLPMALRAAAVSGYYRHQIMALSERLKDLITAAKLYVSVARENEKLSRENQFNLCLAELFAR